jgi:hypothetical protein
MLCKILSNGVMEIDGVKYAWEILGFLLHTVEEESEQRKKGIYKGIYENQ